MKKLRDYQQEISNQGAIILREKMIVYLAMEVRTGKTVTALNICKLNGYKNVLFLTKKKAIKSIQEDYEDFGFIFNLTVTNNESMHKIQGKFDCVVHDESHRFGSFPKPSQGARLFNQLFDDLPLILLSGTPTPESFSQIFHQFWVSKYSPFPHGNFYAWAKQYVNVTQRNLGYGLVNDYSKANESKIREIIDPYMISFTQKESGFTSKVNEHIEYCTMSEQTYKLAEKLKKDLIVIGKEEEILGDTAVKLMSKLHQIYSGTVKFESRNTMILDRSKAEFILNRWSGLKLGIFYKFKAEYDLLKDVFRDNITNDLDEFNNTNKSIALQFVAGREGLSLRNADLLVAMNIDFSATTYFQFKDRMTTKERVTNDLYWIFANGGIESLIYKKVINKKNFTSGHFEREFLAK